MGNLIVPTVRANLRKPTTNSVGGWIVKRIFKERNVYLSENAVRECKFESDHTALEIGFGYGFSLQEACNLITDGKVYGIDFSQAMVDYAKKALPEEISSGKLSITCGNVYNMPYEANTFDRVYHSNCYYFWDDIERGCTEIYRVMKPNSVMVTTMNQTSLKEAVRSGALLESEVNVDRYMDALKSVGFENVNLSELKDSRDDRPFEVVYAHVFDKSVK